MSGKRLQRRRTRGWRMPAGAVYVGRPSPWGNPWRIGDEWYDVLGTPDWTMSTPPIRIPDAETAVRAYREDMGLLMQNELEDAIGPLRGKDLVCWCPLDQPCHADVLLEFAS